MSGVEQLVEYRIQMYQIVIPVFLLISCFAVLANGVVIWALRGTKVRNATVTLILSLTVSDMWTSSIVACSLLYNSYLPTVQGTAVNPCFSLLLEMLRTGGLITGTLQLLLIAAHHYISIVRPHSNKKMLKNIALVLCLGAWILPLTVLFALSLIFEDQGFYNCYNVRFYHSRVFRTSVSVLLLIIFLMIMYCYSKLLCMLRTQSAKWRSKSAQNRMTRENKTLWTAILICSSFFVGWAPATIHFTITCNTCDLLREQRFRVLFLFSCIQLSFILGKSLLNPLIYSLRIPEVDAQIRDIFSGWSECVRTCGRWKHEALVRRSVSKRSAVHRLAPEERLLEQISWNGECTQTPIPTEQVMIMQGEYLNPAPV
ncbi:unnamed protein product [Bursaphelenchus xylophilus]|uniref:(pine wood nematode) hypothetical protein n=1 Tax=Bursaphelenchus xylophilus TaxID=6326 RepID=A0A1I7RPE8_BURXY|nr:unnamed protein product [Bursaphelenchus xylophilus]CAG9095906.1 unnamed protein product [Bursaphelenchus xylophilus]